MTSPPQPAYFARLEVLSELNDALERKLSIKTMDAFGRINPDFAVLFGLSESEVARLNQEIQAARENLSEIEANHATITFADDGTFVVSIAPFPAEGGEVYDHFMNRVQAVLGPERWRFYNKLSSADFSRSSELGMFGLNETRIHLKPTQNNQGTMSWTSGIRAEDGVMERKVDMHPKLLQIHYPRIHRKMIEAGLLPSNR